MKEPNSSLKEGHDSPKNGDGTGESPASLLDLVPENVRRHQDQSRFLYLLGFGDAQVARAIEHDLLGGVAESPSAAEILIRERTSKAAERKAVEEKRAAEQKSAAEKAAAEKKAAEEKAAAEKAAAEKAAAEKAAAEKAAAEKAAAEKAAAEKAAAEKAAAEKAAAEKAAAEKAAAEKAAAEKAAAEKAAAEKAAAEKAAAEKAAAEKAAAEKAAAEKAAAEKKAAEEKAAAEKAAAEKKAAEEKAAAEKAAAEKKAAEKTAAEEKAAAEKKAAEEKAAAGKKGAEGKTAEEKKAAEEKAAEEKAAAEKAKEDLSASLDLPPLKFHHPDDDLVEGDEDLPLAEATPGFTEFAAGVAETLKGSPEGRETEEKAEELEGEKRKEKPTKGKWKWKRKMGGRMGEQEVSKESPFLEGVEEAEKVEGLKEKKVAEEKAAAEKKVAEEKAAAEKKDAEKKDVEKKDEIKAEKAEKAEEELTFSSLAGEKTEKEEKAEELTFSSLAEEKTEGAAKKKDELTFSRLAGEKSGKKAEKKDEVQAEKAEKAEKGLIEEKEEVPTKSLFGAAPKDAGKKKEPEAAKEEVKGEVEKLEVEAGAGAKGKKGEKKEDKGEKGSQKSPFEKAAEQARKAKEGDKAKKREEEAKKVADQAGGEEEESKKKQKPLSSLFPTPKWMKGTAEAAETEVEDEAKAEEAEAKDSAKGEVKAEAAEQRIESAGPAGKKEEPRAEKKGIVEAKAEEEAKKDEPRAGKKKGWRKRRKFFGAKAKAEGEGIESAAPAEKKGELRTEKKGEVEAEKKGEVQAKAEKKDEVQAKAEKKGEVQGKAEKKGEVQGKAEKKDEVQAKAEKKGEVQAEKKGEVEAEKKDEVQGKAEKKDEVQAEEKEIELAGTEAKEDGGTAATGADEVEFIGDGDAEALEKETGKWPHGGIGTAVPGGADFDVKSLFGSGPVKPEESQEGLKAKSGLPEGAEKGDGGKGGEGIFAAPTPAAKPAKVSVAFATEEGRMVAPCPKCSHLLNVNTNMIGVAGNCPNCREPIIAGETWERGEAQLIVSLDERAVMEVASGAKGEPEAGTAVERSREKSADLLEGLEGAESAVESLPALDSGATDSVENFVTSGEAVADERKKGIVAAGAGKLAASDEAPGVEGEGVEPAADDDIRAGRPLFSPPPTSERIFPYGSAPVDELGARKRSKGKIAMVLAIVAVLLAAYFAFGPKKKGATGERDEVIDLVTKGGREVPGPVGFEVKASGEGTAVEMRDTLEKMATEGLDNSLSGVSLRDGPVPAVPGLTIGDTALEGAAPATEEAMLRVPAGTELPQAVVPEKAEGKPEGGENVGVGAEAKATSGAGAGSDADAGVPPLEDLSHLDERDQISAVAKHALLSFLKSPTVEAKSKFVLHPERARPEMEKYFAENEREKFEGIVSLEGVLQDEETKLWVSAFNIWEPGNSAYVLVYVVGNKEVGQKIDWDWYHQVRGEGIKAYFSEPQKESTLVRAVLRRTHFYGETADGEPDPLCVRVETPFTQNFTGTIFLEPYSPIAQQLRRELKWSQERMATVELEWVENDAYGTGKRVVVKQLVGWGLALDRAF